MKYENKLWNRTGKTFSNRIESFDLSNLKYLHTGIDTVKQLYNCMPRVDLIEEFEDLKAAKARPIVEVCGIEWFFTRSSKTSGFQYILKNIDLGFVCMLKSFYKDSNESGTHLKIEVTPQKLLVTRPEDLQAELLQIARTLCYQVVPCGVAVHIAVDVKGFELPQDFEAHIVAKAKRQFKAAAISEAQFSLNEIATVYGKGETYTFGNAGALQCCIYDKTEEAKKSDKIGFWEREWERTPSTDDPFEPEYKDGDQVRRIEMRFHHTIIQQFCNGSKGPDGERLVIRDICDLEPHLTALWRYALNNFRYQHSSSYIHPVWQSLMEDIAIYPPAPDWFYKRATKDPSPSSKRNVAFWLGNQLKLMARRRMSVKFAVGWIMQSGLNEELASYFGCMLIDGPLELDMHLTLFIEKKFQEHRINGVAA